ncbi:hypothetical protein SAMN02745135_00237 [Caloranaerobacter azorensis DSM 13643]|uniref:DUF2325 domain-containing protein n=1 Tax=Caloranaerobacter azorensis DSM 13643 TaxID=1121264 RepID=A0A1M5RHZ8_9FIRM|nr:DUF2325 domain-containing protein [Caloranaerobacter azorensis]SHH25871.1 hypothetical protein SAMN02745135_00237 [Caloranaerobacter azorensis DSM 13643]
MSIVVIGGHERMCKLYKDIGKKYGCRIKVFTHMNSNLDKRIGKPDYIVMFTDVVSHKLVCKTLKLCKNKNIPNLRLHNSSLNTLESALENISKSTRC